MRHPYLYRVLRADEDHKKGLKAAAPNSSLSISDHVAVGSRLSSKYISTCSNLSTARRFADLGISRRGGTKTIVTIDVAKLEQVWGVQIIDLTDSYTRQIHCGSSSQAMRYASDWDEVIVIGEIPAHCITAFETR